MVRVQTRTASTWLSVWLSHAAVHAPPASTVAAVSTRVPLLAATFSGLRSRLGTGLCGGGVAAGLAGLAGRSAVSAARSAWVRDASASVTRESNSSLVSRSCTKASLSVSTTCSRSAREARMRPWSAGTGRLRGTGGLPDGRLRTGRPVIAALMHHPAPPRCDAHQSYSIVLGSPSWPAVGSDAIPGRPRESECHQAATGEADTALGSRRARAARPPVRISTIVMAMTIRPSVMAAPVTWWAAHHWASWAENQWVAP